MGILLDFIANATRGSKLPPGKPRTDLHEWPDGSLRWRPYDEKRAGEKRNINNERLVRRALRLTVGRSGWVRQT